MMWKVDYYRSLADHLPVKEQPIAILNVKVINDLLEKYGFGVLRLSDGGTQFFRKGTGLRAVRKGFEYTILFANSPDRCLGQFTISKVVPTK